MWIFFYKMLLRKGRARSCMRLLYTQIPPSGMKQINAVCILLRISSRLKRQSLDLSSHFVGPLRWDASLVISSPPISQIEYEETHRLWERKKSREGWISLLGLSDWVPWEKAINWLAMTDKSSLSIYSLEYRISSSRWLILYQGPPNPRHRLQTNRPEH